MNMAQSSSEHLLQNGNRMPLQHVVAAFKPGSGEWVLQCECGLFSVSSSLVYMYFPTIKKFPEGNEGALFLRYALRADNRSLRDRSCK